MVDPASFVTAAKSLGSYPIIKACIAATCAFLTKLIGPDWIAYEVLFILVMIDVATGTMVAWKRHKLSSVRFFQKGIYLLLYFLLLISAHQVERLIEIPLIELEVVTAYFLAISEFISIMENSASLGIPFPNWIMEKLENFINNDPSG